MSTARSMLKPAIASSDWNGMVVTWMGRLPSLGKVSSVTEMVFVARARTIPPSNERHAEHELHELIHFLDQSFDVKGLGEKFQIVVLKESPGSHV